MDQPHNMTDYEKTYAEFEWIVPDKYNFARDVIDRWAEKDPQKRAMLWVDGNLGDVYSYITCLLKRRPVSRKVDSKL